MFPSGTIINPTGFTLHAFINCESSLCCKKSSVCQPIKAKVYKKFPIHGSNVVKLSSKPLEIT